MKNLKFLALITFVAAGFFLSVSCNSCQSQKKASNESMSVAYTKISPDFDADSAFSYIEKQVEFGPRVPASSAHRECGDYLVSKLETFGATVVEQKANITHYNTQNIEIRNIIGSFNPENEKRIILFAHYDSRPFADRETDNERRNRPIAGADDGASGVGVLLEIARQLQLNPIDTGIDIIFFDMEDWGQAEFDKNYIAGEWWCVGSRYWSENPHIAGYKANFGILLDMVGASGATFMREGYSIQSASPVLTKIWSTAANLGFGRYFVQQMGGYITDDHVPIIQNLKIPCVDIINLKDSDTGFASHWHTLNDDMRNIDKNTLHAVGQTVMEVIYSEISKNN